MNISGMLAAACAGVGDPATPAYDFASACKPCPCPAAFAAIVGVAGAPEAPARFLTSAMNCSAERPDMLEPNCWAISFTLAYATPNRALASFEFPTCALKAYCPPSCPALRFHLFCDPCNFSLVGHLHGLQLRLGFTGFQIFVGLHLRAPFTESLAHCFYVCK